MGSNPICPTTMNTFSMNTVTSLTKHNDSIVIEGVGEAGKVLLELVTDDVKDLWFSLKRAQQAENLRVLREERVERIDNGFFC
jgi:hypothetical protein